MIWRRGLKEKVLGISMQGLGMFSFGEPISMSFNPRMNSINHVNNADKDTRPFSTLTNKDKIIILVFCLLSFSSILFIFPASYLVAFTVKRFSHLVIY